MKIQTLIALAVVMAATGCGSGQMHVWGEVTYDGKPVDKGVIVFTPIEGTPGPSTGGPIEHGSYDVAPSFGCLAGGSYRVEISAKGPGKRISHPDPNVQGPMRFKNLIPKIYNSESTLKVTISQKAAENNFNFGLEKGNIK